jgi:hypothetical protein
VWLPRWRAAEIRRSLGRRLFSLLIALQEHWEEEDLEEDGRRMPQEIVRRCGGGSRRSGRSCREGAREGDGICGGRLSMSEDGREGDEGFNGGVY